ncbi:PB1 domain-containing protein [Artemisia annua]|uniref:PB1 domain-containing protein n=1 Tax=Artemisia annua TaxID=35608 RepID=A0A2U1LV59_ARTAN|nr:PB1 domain-containing protein [Artemisia annua]
MAEIFDNGNNGVFVHELVPAFAARVDLFNLNVSPHDIRNRVEKVFQSFDFQGESGLLQFWECNAGSSKDIGCSLTLTDQIFLSPIHDNRLEEYRMKCLVKNYSHIGRKANDGNFIGVKTKVENWFAGRAVQTGIADHRTRHDVLNQGHQYADEALGMGQLVAPVYFYHSSAGLKLVGIIELVTTQPKESYVRDFNQIQNLLKMENLTSSYMEKMIKVEYNHQTLKFTLPLSAKLLDLEKQVTMRFKELKNKTFCIQYEDGRYICNNQDLKFCLDDSISNRTTVIQMFVKDVA